TRSETRDQFAGRSPSTCSGSTISFLQHDLVPSRVLRPLSFTISPFRPPEPVAPGPRSGLQNVAVKLRALARALRCAGRAEARGARLASPARRVTSALARPARLQRS